MQQIARRRQREDSCSNDVLTSYEVVEPIALARLLYRMMRLPSVVVVAAIPWADLESRSQSLVGSSHPCTRYCACNAYDTLISPSPFVALSSLCCPSLLFIVFDISTLGNAVSLCLTTRVFVVSKIVGTRGTTPRLLFVIWLAQ